MDAASKGATARDEGGTEAAGLAVSADPQDMLAVYGADHDDAVALAAYALHARARHAFEARFAEKHHREPAPAEREAFLLGEMTPRRIAAYRAEAQRLVASAASASPALQTGAPQRKRARWPFFGMWVEAPRGPAANPEATNWRGLFFRLLVLLLAVVTTAILLRVLVVQR